MWTNIDIVQKESFIGRLPRDSGTKSLPLPGKEIIPEGTKEILVYAWVWIGTGVYPQSNWHYKIFVDADNHGHVAAQYLYAHTDPNITVNSFAINSDTFWLPMPVDRTLRVERIFIKREAGIPEEPPPIGGPYFESEIRVIGYR